MTTTRVFQNRNSQWASSRQVIGTFPSDFMHDREQPSWKDVSESEEL